MDAATTPSATITCAKPSCGALTTAAESVYIDGCGQVCPAVRARSRRGWTTSSPRSNRWPRCSPGAPPPGGHRASTAPASVPLRHAVALAADNAAQRPPRGIFLYAAGARPLPNRQRTPPLTVAAFAPVSSH
jgi:hypothetical protein